MGEMSKTNMDRHRSYRIGLDIGIASVGWAVLENNSQDEPIRILDLGVRIFEAAEVPKTGAALAAERRDARTARRRIRRRRHRLERIKWLFEREGLIQIDSFMERYHSPNLPDVYELRYEGLERKLSKEEFAQVLLHIAKHRGFRSTRKAELKEGDNGKVLKATEENRKRMEEHGYRMIQKISRSTQYREVLYKGQSHPDYEIVDVETGEIISLEDLSREEWDERYGAQVPPPWEHFKEELEVRMGSDPKNDLDAHPDMYQLFRYPEDVYNNIRPIFVSRMPNHKVTGAAHADTIRSPRHYKDGGEIFADGGYVLSRTNIEDLKLDKDGEIKDYYNKDSDRLLYEALRARLAEYDGDGKKAFAEEFYKPKADGTQGPIVKKVKTYKKMSLGVEINKDEAGVGRGIAENANGGMIRVDIFRENGKYYFVPIYIADALKKRLPNKAAMQNKPYSEWKEMKDENFLFSLYSRDLIGFKNPKGKKVKCKDGKEIVLTKEIVYYVGANINTASISCKAHDNQYEFGSFGIQSLQELKKYQVDVLGNITEVRQEKRRGFH